jgi:hypothetical protein
MKEREPQFFQALSCLLCKIYCRELVKLAKAIARWAEKLSRNSIALNAIVFKSKIIFLKKGNWLMNTHW